MNLSGKGRIFILSLTITLGLARVARAIEITELAWNEANIRTLRGLDKEAYFRFYIRQEDPENEQEWTADTLGLEYDWYPAGDGTYELVINSQTGPDVAFLDLYWRDSRGRITNQEFPIFGDFGERWFWGSKYVGINHDGEQFADLDRDGFYELILFVPLKRDWPPQRTKFIPDGEWLQVWRLKNGKYVEASRDFPGFYTKQILPKLDAAIAQAREAVDQVPADKANPHPGISDSDDYWNSPARYLAALIMTRDKILRFLRIDPNAGLEQAREWMKSPDPVLVDDAVSVFRDVGGHDAEVRAARLARDRAAEHWPFRQW